MSCPPTKPAIAVITPNILIGLGLRTILEKVGPPGEIAARSISSAAKNGWYTICCACAAKRLDPTMPFPGSTALRPPTCSPYAKRKC